MRIFPFHHPPAVAVALNFLVMSVLHGSWIARLPDIQDRLHLSEGQIGFCLMGFAGGVTLGTPLVVPLMDRLGSGKTMFLALAILCVMYVLPTLAPNLWVLGGLLFLVGVCDGAVNIAMNGTASTIERTAGIQFMSSCHGVFSVGLAIGAATSGWISQRGVDFFDHLAVLALVLFLLVLSFRKRLYALPHTPGEKQKLRRPPRALVGLATILLCVNVADGAMIDWSAIYLREVIGSNAFVAGLGLAVFSSGMALGRFGGDAVRARFSARQILSTGALVNLLGMSIVLFGGHAVLVLVGFFLAGLGLSVAVPVVYSQSTQTEGIAPNVGLAAVATVSMVGFMGGPPVIGFISEATSLHWGFAFVMVLTAISLVLIRRTTTPT